MPFRFTEDALPALNSHHKNAKDMNPCYLTTSSEIGRLQMEAMDFHMRWYGRTGTFTSGWVAEPKTKVNTGLNTGMDRSAIHPRYFLSCLLALNSAWHGRSVSGK